MCPRGLRGLSELFLDSVRLGALPIDLITKKIQTLFVGMAQLDVKGMKWPPIFMGMLINRKYLYLHCNCTVKRAI